MTKPNNWATVGTSGPKGRLTRMQLVSAAMRAAQARKAAAVAEAEVWIVGVRARKAKGDPHV